MAPTLLCRILLVGAPCIDNEPEAVDIVTLLDSSSSKFFFLENSYVKYCTSMRALGAK